MGWEYKHYRVTIKEVGNDKPIVTEYHGEVGRDYLVQFYGLDHDDVEWYKIEEIENGK